MRAPLLHVYEELDAQMAPDFTLIRSLDRSDRWLVRAGALHHIHFTTIGALVPFSPGLFKATSATTETEPACNALLETPRAFFSAFVAETPDARTETARWQPPESRELRAERLPASR